MTISKEQHVHLFIRFNQVWVGLIAFLAKLPAHFGTENKCVGKKILYNNIIAKKSSACKHNFRHLTLKQYF